MVHTTNQVNIYRKANESLFEEAGFSFNPLQLSYSEGDSIRVIEEIELEEESVFINKYDSNWTPEEHNLTLSQKFYIKKPDLLFGEEGIVAQDNLIGFGVHIFSPHSFFQTTEEIGVIKFQETEKVLNFSKDFDSKSLRGEVNFQFFIYLKHKSSMINGQAKTVGLRLCEDDLHSYSLIIDGDGSNFPILQFEEKEGPLWKIEKNWIDSADDTFDSSNVYIALNTKHYLFERLKSGATKSSQGLMGEIMLQSLSMIINEVVNVEKQDLSEEETTPGTILAAVKYWVETFDVQTDSIFSINNSLRTNQSYQMYGG